MPTSPVLANLTAVTSIRRNDEPKPFPQLQTSALLHQSQPLLHQSQPLLHQSQPLLHQSLTLKGGVIRGP